MGSEGGVLQAFCAGVAERQKRFGFDWSQLIVTLLPVVVEMITTCFESAADLQSFAEGKRPLLRLAGLRIRCNQAARQLDVVGPMRVQRAGKALVEDILAELDDQAAKAAGPDVYQLALAEAASV